MRWEEIDGEVVLTDEQVGKPALRYGQAGPPEADRYGRLFFGNSMREKVPSGAAGTSRAPGGGSGERHCNNTNDWHFGK